MNYQRRELSREHHFYISIAKFLFHHSRYGIVAASHPITLSEAKQRGLVPIILYGVTVAGLPIRWLIFSTVDRRISLRNVLLTAWKNAEGLRGTPDVLRVNRYVAQADPGLAEDLAKIGVRLEIAEAKDKTFPTSLRSAQNASRNLIQRHSPEVLSLTACVDALCLDAQDDHDLSVRCGSRGLSNRKLEESIERWLHLPMRKPLSIHLEGRNWEAGPWLSSWDMQILSNRPRYFYHDDIIRRTWLLVGQAPSGGADEDNDQTPANEEQDDTPRIARHLLACWPNLLKEVAPAVGITLRQLQWFNSYGAGLDGPARCELSRLLGIEFDEHMGGYKPAGPYVLIARKARAIEAIYQEISGGGDACPCELVPAQGQADPSWRYVLINAHSQPPTIVMAPRGEAITEHLPGLMMNYEGIRPVSPAFYRDVVATCARACQTPQANVREMKKFASRYRQHWVGCVWLPD